MTGSKATKQDNLKVQITRAMRYEATKTADGHVELGCQEMANRFNTTVDNVRLVLKSLASDSGTGVKQGRGPSVFEFNATQRAMKLGPRKAPDRHAGLKAVRYMLGTTPGSLHQVSEIGEAIGVNPTTVSAALNRAETRDRHLHISRWGMGVFTYRPPGWDLAPQAPADEYTGEKRSGLEFVDAPPAMEGHYDPEPPRGLAIPDVFERDDEPHPTPRLDRLMQTPADDFAMAQVTYKKIGDLTNGMELLESSKGEIYEARKLGSA